MISWAAVDAALVTFSRYGAFDVDPEKAMRYAILAAIATQEREDASERAHARRRDDPLRLAETRTILDQARQRAAVRHTLNGMRDAMAQSFGTRHS